VKTATRLPWWKRIAVYRRAVQLLVFAGLLALPITARYAHYLSARSLDKTIDSWRGTLPGALMGLSDKALRLGIPDGEGGVATRRPRKKLLARARAFYGSAWSARLFGVSMTDLLAGVESAAASRTMRLVLVTGLAIPLIATALLGRVFCGWICPMGILSALARKTRELLVFLELKPFDLKVDPRAKYFVLAAGALVVLATGLPLLHHIYPPALFGREAHAWVAAVFDRAESGRTGFFWVGLSSASLFLLALFLLETAAAPGLWCRSLCPGGALYSLVGRFRLLRVKRKAAGCVDCSICDELCPMGLFPMTDRIGMECDNCGICVDACPTHALSYILKPPEKRRAGKLASAVLSLLFLGASTVEAHHIMGIPHYSYDESYPQAPVLKLVETVGPWEFQLTGYPGNPTPGVRTELHAYAVATATKKAFEGDIELEVFEVLAFGAKKSIYGPDSGRRDKSLHKYFPTYATEGNYELVLSFMDEGIVSTLRFPMVVGEPGSPWTAVGLFAACLASFLVLIRAVRIKRRRALGAEAAA